MADLLRQEIAATAKTIVVKVGTRVLSCQDGTLNETRIHELAGELSRVSELGRRVVLVSSGAVGAGMSRLGLAKRPTDLAALQAVAAIGQTNLVEAYDRTFKKHGRHAAQVLLTADDLDDRTRYLNVRHTLLRLLNFGAIPVINENDTVAVDELMTTFGDNDRLAAMVANLLGAELLVILSDVDGVYDGHPQDGGTKLISTVTKLDTTIQAYVRDEQNGVSKGGMASKLEAARIVTTAGENVVIASGREPGVLEQILAGAVIGTLVVAQGKSVSSRKRWLGFSALPRGRITLDDGARDAILCQGSSLLAIGIVRTEGEFKKGDVVSLFDTDDTEIARGLTNYDNQEIRQIKGLRSDEIANILGHLPYEEVVHRDNLLDLSGGA